MASSMMNVWRNPWLSITTILRAGRTVNKARLDLFRDPMSKQSY
jgi:hypothetical protein